MEKSNSMSGFQSLRRSPRTNTNGGLLKELVRMEQYSGGTPSDSDEEFDERGGLSFRHPKSIKRNPGMAKDRLKSRSLSSGAASSTRGAKMGGPRTLGGN